MDFAKNLMKKYGWKEGIGLGKNSSGITKPLQANLKFDTAGLGVDKAEEFNNHWWERVFNDAANNVNVNKNGEKIEISIKDEDSVEITTKEYSVKRTKKQKQENGYNHFLKKSVLNGLNETHAKDSQEDYSELIELPKFQVLNDNELFAACGGRTAHKGARHGLKLSGKLSRLEEQEKGLLEKMDIGNEVVKDEGDWKVVTNKNKKKRKHEMVDQADELEDILFSNEYQVKSKKKRKKEKQLDCELSTAINSVDIGVTQNYTKDVKEKSKRKKGSQVEAEENSDLELEIDTNAITKKKKKKKKSKEDSSIPEENKCCFLKYSNSPPTPEKTSKTKEKRLKRKTKVATKGLETSLSLN